MIKIPIEAKREIKKYRDFDDIEVLMLESQKDLNSGEWFCTKGVIGLYGDQIEYKLDNFKLLVTINKNTMLTLTDKDYNFEDNDPETFMLGYSIQVIE